MGGFWIHQTSVQKNVDGFANFTFKEKFLQPIAFSLETSVYFLSTGVASALAGILEA